MRIVKSLVCLCLLGLTGLAGCDGADTQQASELQPSEPRQAERERILAKLDRIEVDAKEHLICRNLRQGDPWYPKYLYCCDNDSMTQSYWTGATGNPTGNWDGNCFSWGLR